MEKFRNNLGRNILQKLVEAIQQSKDYLSEIDGLIGDGDHGVNMNKGFSVFQKRFLDTEITFTKGLEELGMILLSEIGGSMGPLYGTLFLSMGEECEGLVDIGLDDLYRMLKAGLDGLYEIIEARPGDKTLVDTLYPAMKALDQGMKNHKNFKDTLIDMKFAAKIGCESTKNLIARYGRSSRLGERSKGVQDAGATSCLVLLNALADGIIQQL